MIKIEKKITLVPDAAHSYRSFPTAAVNQRGEVVIAYRDAFFPGEIPPNSGEHGVKGDSYLMRWDPDTEKRSRPKKIYDHRVTGSNEQHAILSGKGRGLYLFSRQHGKSRRVFFARSKNGGKSFTERREVSLKQFEFLSCYGRLRESGGELIAPVYGVAPDLSPENRRCGAAWISSRDNGETWKFGGWIARPLHQGPSFNETALLPLGGKKWIAVLRSGEERERLYYAFSEKGLKKWTRPEPMGFKGEAPELFDLGKGRLGLTYRAFLRDGNFSWSIRVSGDNGRSWARPVRLSVYNGSRFHGGYGDVVSLGDNRWLGVCYSPGPTGFPGIKGILFG